MVKNIFFYSNFVHHHDLKLGMKSKNSKNVNTFKTFKRITLLDILIRI